MSLEDWRNEFKFCEEEGDEKKRKLTENNIGSDGARIGEALKINNTLIKLNLYCNGRLSRRMDVQVKIEEIIECKLWIKSEMKEQEE